MAASRHRRGATPAAANRPRHPRRRGRLLARPSSRDRLARTAADPHADLLDAPSVRRAGRRACDGCLEPRLPAPVGRASASVVERVERARGRPALQLGRQRQRPRRPRTVASGAEQIARRMLRLPLRQEALVLASLIAFSSSTFSDGFLPEPELLPSWSPLAASCASSLAPARLIEPFDEA